jgi:CDP-paratose 2-epimerase
MTQRPGGILGRLLPESGAALPVARPVSPMVILGGAGFIGCNLADRLLRDGHDVVVLDNLSRAGVERNLAWLEATHRHRLHKLVADIRDPDAVREAVNGAGAVFHFAAQVAVTSSLVDPVQDFSINAAGTLTVLEAMRRHAPAAPLLFASTNKVYGALDDLAMLRSDDRVVPQDDTVRRHGIDERRKLDFCTPYGCSKGAADQYVQDYARSFGLRAVVLRMSCIYGPRQFGTEDQGWVAHFLIRALRGETITLYGDGLQVRDVLHVADAVSAYLAALREIDRLRGGAFNLGGGAANAVSLQAALREIELICGHKVPVRHVETRRGDQAYFVADTRLLAQQTGWRATLGWQAGLRDLAAWVRSDLGLEETLPARVSA